MAIDNKQPEVIVMNVVLMSAATIVVGLRCWACWFRKQQRFGWDDAWALMSLPFIISEISLVLWWVHLGLGKHASTVPPGDLAQAPVIIYILALLFNPAMTFPKFSVLCFYRRTFQKKTVQTWFRWALYAVMFMNFGWFVSAMLSTAFQCTPIRKAWDPSVPGKCLPHWPGYLGSATVSMIIDLFILVLPIPLIWNLQAPVSKKIQVIAIFLCGYSVIVISIGRVVTLARAGAEMFDDMTYSMVTYVFWVQCEAPISVIGVCLPTLFFFVRHVHNHGFRRASSSNASNPHHDGSQRSWLRKTQFARLFDSKSLSSDRSEVHTDRSKASWDEKPITGTMTTISSGEGPDHDFEKFPHALSQSSVYVEKDFKVVHEPV